MEPVPTARPWRRAVHPNAPGVSRRSGLLVKTTPDLKKPRIRLPSIVGLVGAAGVASWWGG